MTENGLIHMTAHLVTRPEAARLMAAGVLLVVTGGLLALRLAFRGQWRRFFVAAAAAIAGLVMIINGANQPRVKELKMCAYGPVSLEQVSAVYDVRDVDGKLLTLWER